MATDKQPEIPGKSGIEQVLNRLVTGPVEPDSTEERTSWSAPFDVKQTPQALTIFVDLPGVDEDDIRINHTKNEVRVMVEREFNHDTEDAEEYTHLSRPYGVFECATDIPAQFDPDRMSAKYKRGVLKISIPKK